MVLYAIIMFMVAVAFAALGVVIYRGKTVLIHDYHQTKVTDKAAYGKAFGKAMLALAAGFLLSGIIGLIDPVLAVAVLVIGLVIGIGCIIAVQRKYNQGVF